MTALASWLLLLVLASTVVAGVKAVTPRRGLDVRHLTPPKPVHMDDQAEFRPPRLDD